MSRMLDELRKAENRRRQIIDRFVEVARPALSPFDASPAAGEAAEQTQMSKETLRQLGILRNSVETLLKDKGKRTLVFTSSTWGEGTTTVATNFAKFLALQKHEKVLVFEMNARRPAFSGLFSINGDAGLTDYFTGKSDLRSLVRTVGPYGLGVVPVGQTDPTTIQLNLERGLPRLIQEAYRDYDTVIIDSPPVISFPETAAMAAFVDGVVMVVFAGRTKREVVSRAMDSISKFGGNVLGVVLNRKKYYIPEFLYKRI